MHNSTLSCYQPLRNQKKKHVFRLSEGCLRRNDNGQVVVPCRSNLTRRPTAGRHASPLASGKWGSSHPHQRFKPPTQAHVTRFLSWHLVRRSQRHNALSTTLLSRFVGTITHSQLSDRLYTGSLASCPVPSLTSAVTRVEFMSYAEVRLGCIMYNSADSFFARSTVQARTKLHDFAHEISKKISGIIPPDLQCGWG